MDTKQFSVILFDLDGTLSNSKEGITKCVQYALSKSGIEENDLDKLEHFIGPPLLEELMKTYNFSEEEATVTVADYRERYIPIGVYETCLYPGIKEMLKKLKEADKMIGLATSKPKEMAEEVLRYLGIYEYFDYIMGAQINGPIHSKTDVLLALFDLMEKESNTKVDLDSIVLIGDTVYDVEGAFNTGIKCIGVEYGFGNKEEMKQAGAICVVKNTEELVGRLT